MKTLLFILLLSPYAWSQYPPSQALPDAYTLVDSSVHIVFTEIPPLRSLDVYSDMFIPRLLTDWKAYTEECWADSDAQWVETFRWVEESRSVSSDGSESVTKARKWAGYNPAPAGFMLYLERKYPQKGVKP